jgi:hypothetical protein
MLGSLSTSAMLLGMWALVVWQLWLGLAKGYFPTGYTGRAERATRPIAFGFIFLFYAVALLVLGGLLVSAIFFWLIHPTTP